MKQYNFETRPKANAKAIVQGPCFRFTVLTDGLVRYEYAEDNQFEDRASTFAINRDLPVPKFRLVDGEDALEIITDRFHLRYDRKPFSPGGLTLDTKGRLTLWGASWHYGDFSRTLGGTARTLDEADGRIPLGSGILSKLGYACIDDRDSMLFDGNGWVGTRKPGFRDDGYIFAYGHNYKDAVKAFYQLSGNQPLLPRWALGNWWSRYHPYTQDEYVELVDRFRKEGIPLSVAVLDMDWHLVADERVSHTGWTGYSWDSKLFPDPGAYGRAMHERNLKISLNDHPHGGVHAFEDCYGDMAKALGHDTSHKSPILFDPTNKKFFESFFNVAHRSVEKDACDFWWIDWQQGKHSRIPGIDPLWMLNHFQFLDTGLNHPAPLIFSRYAGPGSHRYPVGFSGDSITTWNSLDFQPEFTATASNIGYGWWSHDMGGHMMGGRDDELVTRWIQYGVFSPIFRLHSTNSQWQSKEPWLFRKESVPIITEFLKYRHRLMPYLYSMNVRSAKEYEPIVQPMYWSWPEREEAYSVPNQYYFGSELIVAPITTPRNLKTHLGVVRAWLPPGRRYVDIFTSIVYDANRMISLYRPLYEYPVLAGEGSIIPLDADLSPRNGGLNPTAFEVLVVIGANAQLSIPEDPDDDSPETKSKAPDSNERGALIQYFQDEGKLSAKVTGRSWTFRFLAFTNVKLGNIKATVNGKPFTDLEVEISTSPPSLLIKIPALTDEKASIDIHIGPNPQLDIFDYKARLFELLLDYQVDFSIKDQMWTTIDPSFVPFGASGNRSPNPAHSPLAIKIGQLMAMGIDETIMGPVIELLVADTRSS